ncbi:hypothetical protein B0H21DRAFT_747519 [Amylocystis lapponica]|nr:hypothetical protein B0H21DRAFT_747519 [Amylocystis lapponica]
MSVRTLVNAVSAPWARRSTSKGKAADVNHNTRDEELGRRPLLTVTLPSQQSFGPTPPVQSYGATSSGRSSVRASPERLRRDGLLGRVPEEGGPVEGTEGEDADEAEWDLEEQGFYKGSYRHTVALYTIVPSSSLLTFIILAFLPVVIWKREDEGLPDYSRYFPSPLPELLVSASLWSLSHLLRLPLYNLTTTVVRNYIAGTLLFHIIYAILSQLLRLAALPILHIRHRMLYPLPTWQDPAFHRVWWVALGWACVEVGAGIVQGYEQIALYRNAMVSEATVREWLTRWKDGTADNGNAQGHTPQEEILPLSPRTPGTAQSAPQKAQRPHTINDVVRMAVEQDVEQLITLKEREELEEIYGLPVIRIPVFVSCLQRIDSFLLSLGMTLILASSYLRSPISFPDRSLPPLYTNRPFFITFPVVVFLNLFLSLLHIPPVFTGLGLWGALS